MAAVTEVAAERDVSPRTLSSDGVICGSQSYDRQDYFEEDCLLCARSHEVKYLCYPYIFAAACQTLDWSYQSNCLLNQF